MDNRKTTASIIPVLLCTLYVEELFHSSSEIQAKVKLERHKSLESLANHLKQQVDTMAGKSSATRKGLQFLRLAHTSKPLNFRIVVMGAEDVGKTGKQKCYSSSEIMLFFLYW
ncbi:hypothetical protein AVEN_92614-1 [Araneus ventricosus]|uniref:Uncharacterized protein n=1 Tax=Araneus ventricosus TaxID=182803 RepID=A0A4Y2AJN5_ARAVE|nr:hypothetical protein AVEN_92614-1 [Araneus ventricosus]